MTYKHKAALGLAATLAVASATHAAEGMSMEGKRHGAELTVSVTNLTARTWLAPILVAAHPAGYRAYTEGEAASPELQAIAEIGDIEPLANVLPARASVVRNPANGPLKPGATATAHGLSGGRHGPNTHLSVLAMLVPTNDGFIGLNAIEIPKMPGTYRYTVMAYDAGTEANNEAAAAGPGVNQPGMGLPPFLADGAIDPNAPGFGQTVKEGFVHIHRGIVGSAPGGPSVLDASLHRWMNPVARVTLTVK